MDSQVFSSGEHFMFEGKEVVIVKQENLDCVCCQFVATGYKIRVSILKLSPVLIPTLDLASMDLVQDEDVATSRPKAWAKAGVRMEMMNALKDGMSFKEVAMHYQVHISRLYVYSRYFDGTRESLLDKPKGGKAKTRLTPAVEALIEQVIKNLYLNKQRLQVVKVYEECKIRCIEEKLKPPTLPTIYNRVEKISDFIKLSRRLDYKQVRDKVGINQGTLYCGEYPLHIVQLDHALVDLITVDEFNRLPVGRPWLTVAIDTYSRMVIGFYLSYDRPSATSVSMCLAHSMYPKEEFLRRLEMAEDSWPCWGPMKILSTDNAKEFYSQAFTDGCEKYGIDPDYRPRGQPHFGGYIERFIGSILNETHAIPGTTFSDVKQRKGYDSEKNACMTLSELEELITIWIVTIYHNKIHSGLKMAPIVRYREAFNPNGSLQLERPIRYSNQFQLKLHFMPFKMRTIQGYGIRINHIHYCGPELLEFRVETSRKSRPKEKFRYDPRDISKVYFYNPKVKKYFPIPYSDLQHPAVSFYEVREACKKAKP